MIIINIVVIFVIYSYNLVNNYYKIEFTNTWTWISQGACVLRFISPGACILIIDVFVLWQTLEQYGISSGDSALLINGITMDVETVDMFSLYDTIKNDLTIMDELSQHGLAVSCYNAL